MGRAVGQLAGMVEFTIGERVLEQDIDELFAAPLERFIAVRNGIVRRLTDEGAREAAVAMAAIRKPTVSVWVVNQLARGAAGDVADLVAAGEALEAIQREAMTGGAGTGYEEARAREATAIGRLEKAARQVMPSITAQTTERVLTTLRAGAASTPGRALLTSGHLQSDIEPAGFDLFAAGLQSVAPRAAPSRNDQAARQRLEKLRARACMAGERAVVAAADAQRAADEADMAERRARKARRDADAAAARAEKQRAEAVRLAGELALADADQPPVSRA